MAMSIIAMPSAYWEEPLTEVKFPTIITFVSSGDTTRSCTR